MVVIKLAVILMFIGLAAWYVNPPTGGRSCRSDSGGVMTAAAIVFLAYVGFDAVSTTAEEAVNPQRDMPIGIIGSLLVATVLYMAVSAIMTGVVPYGELSVADPVALVLNKLNMPWASAVVSVGAIAGITSVLLVLLMGQPRILFAMSRDGLLPAALCRGASPLPHALPDDDPHRRHRGGRRRADAPRHRGRELCSIGTLLAFMIVSAGVIVLRSHARRTSRVRSRSPLSPFVPLLGIVLCGYLMFTCPR